MRTISVLLIEPELGGVEEAVDDVGVVLDAVVDELGVARRGDHEQRGGLAVEHRGGKADVGLVPVVEDLRGNPLGSIRSRPRPRSRS
jgi:hypothetical protein